MNDGDSEPEKSEIFTQRTDVSGPGPPRITNITCIPPNSFFVQWQKPVIFYDTIDFYYISYRSESATDFEEIAIDTSKENVDFKVS